MDIAAMSIGMSQAKVAQEVGTSVAKIIIDSARSESADLLRIMDVNMGISEMAIDPNTEGMIDTYA